MFKVIGGYMGEGDKKIRSFKDLYVYQNTYSSMLVIMKEVINQLPDYEKYDLTSQLRRSCKAIPRLIAEGFAKKHQKAGFQKYLDDSIGECNEIIVSLEQARDLYGLEKDQIDILVSKYDISARQIYKLSQSWTKFKKREN